MKKSFLGLIMGILLITPLGQVAKAYSPSLSVFWDGGNVRIVVSGAQPNTRVDVYYRSQNSQVWSVTSGLGNTDWNGYFSSTVNLGLQPGSSASIYAVVGTDQTPTVNLGYSGGCWGSNCYSGNLTFSQNNVSLSAGQSQSVNIYSAGGYYGGYYISNNSNSSVVSASVSGNILNLYGQAPGSANITVCQSGSYYNYGNACGTVYVTVGGGMVGGITFSPSNPTLYVGQSLNVTVNTPYFYSGSFYVSINSNPSVASASISGNNLALYGQAPGSANITVCQSGSYYNYGNACGTVYVTVGNYNYDTFYLNPSSVNLSVGQTATVMANFSYTYSGYLYLASNSNPGVATVSFTGSAINVYGQTVGSTVMNICYSGQCRNLYVTVTGGNCYYGSGCYGNNLYFTSTSLPQPIVNQYYSVQLQVTGGSGSYTYVLDSGSLPTGLTLSSSGLISGIPINTNTASFSVRVSDSYGRFAVASLVLTPQQGSVLGAMLFNNGSLIREDGTVYIVYKNTKTGFASAYAFLGLGFKFSQVMRVANSGLADSGYVVSTPNAGHPWGSWIKSGRTVYFVHENGLIPVPSADIFLNNGGDWNVVVAANAYDFNRPVLPNLDYNDSRLR